MVHWLSLSLVEVSTSQQGRTATIEEAGKGPSMSGVCSGGRAAAVVVGSSAYLQAGKRPPKGRTYETSAMEPA